jgi:hypothetical protein
VEASATLANGDLNIRLAARQLDGEGRLNVQARYDGTQLHADVAAEEPAGTLLGAPLSLHLDLDGPATGAALAPERALRRGRRRDGRHRRA